MSSIDERIVRMKFDNQGFESGVSTTMSTLEKLKNALKFKGGTDGLDQVSNGINKLNSSGLGGLASGVDGVSAKFSALGVMAVTALANITNSAVNAGKNLIKSFAIDPITDGFSEYELKMNSIQTILTNTAKHGTTLKDVNSALNELNAYSDKTIYNFGQMTDNIGKATAAGLELDQAVTFVKGMSNAAAGFGVDATRMAGATYQMTQALSAGVIKLMDWNSLQQAGMGGEMMQEEMYKAAEGMGVFVDKSVPFRDSLQSGWLTSEIFMKAMENMANNESLTKAASDVTSFTKLLGTLKETVGSGWAQSFEHIFGDKEQSTELWTGISNSLSDIINRSSEARNKMLQFWNEAGGRDAVIQGLTNIVNTLGKGLSAVGDAFREVFPPMTREKLVEISKGFKNLTENFKMSDKTIGKIKDTFKGLFSIFDLGKNIITGLFKVIGSTGGIFGALGSVILTVTSGIGKFISSINDGIEKSNIFGKAADVISSAFKSIGNVLSDIAGKIDNFFSSLGSLNIGSVFSGIGSVLGDIFGGISEALGSVDFGTIFQGLALLLTGGIFNKITNFFDGFSDILSSFLGIADSASGVLDSVKGALEAYQSDLDAGKLLKLSAAVGLLAGSLLLLASIKPANMDSAIAGLMTVMIGLGVMLKFMQTLNLGGMMKSLQITLLISSMVALATAILILAGAMKVISSLSWEELAIGLTGTIALIGSLIAVSKLMNTQSSGMIKTGLGLIALAAALRVLVGVVKELGSLDANTLIQGLTGIAALLTELGIAMKLVDFGGLGIKNAAGLLIFAASLTILSNAVKSLGAMDANALVQGLVGVAAILTEIGAFTKLVGNPTGLLSTSAALLVMGAAMNVMAGAVRSFASMNWQELAVGLTGMAGALLIMAAAVKLIPGGTLIATAVGVAAMSASMLVLSSALTSLGGLSWEQLAVGLAALAGSLVIFAGAMMAMQGCIMGAAAMLVMAGALALFVPQIVALSQLSLAGVGTALLALAGAFVVIGAAGLLLAPVVPALLGLGVAVGLLGVGCMAAGAGLTLIATGLGMIASVAGPAIQALVGGFQQLIELLPSLGTNLGMMIGNLATSLGAAIPQVVTAIGQLIVGLLQALTSAIPQITTTAIELITAFCTALGTAIPQIISVGVDLILALLEGVASNMGELVTRGVDCIVNFINGIASNLGRVIQAGIGLVNSLADGIRSNGPAATSAVINLISAVVSTLVGAVGQFLSAGAQWIGGLISGITQKVGGVLSQIGSMISQAVSKCTQSVSQWISAGASMIGGLLSGIKQKAGELASAAASAAKSALDAAKSALGINSPSREFMEVGRFSMEGLAAGIKKNTYKAEASVKSTSNRLLDATSYALSAMSDVMNAEIETDPTIKPVLDLSNVEKGSKRIGQLMSANEMTLATESPNAISKTIGTIQNVNDNSDILSALKDLKGALANTGNTTYRIDGITYDDGSNVTSAVQTLVRAAKIERRI